MGYNCFSMLYACVVYYTKNTGMLIRQAMKHSMEAAVAAIPTPVRNANGAEEAGPNDDTVPADLSTSSIEEPTLVFCLKNL